MEFALAIADCPYRLVIQRFAPGEDKIIAAGEGCRGVGGKNVVKPPADKPAAIMPHESAEGFIGENQSVGVIQHQHRPGYSIQDRQQYSRRKGIRKCLAHR